MIKDYKDWKEYGEHSSIPNEYYDSVLGSTDHNWFGELFNKNFKSKVIGKSLLYWKKEDK